MKNWTFIGSLHREVIIPMWAWPTYMVPWHFVAFRTLGNITVKNWNHNNSNGIERGTSRHVEEVYQGCLFSLLIQSSHPTRKRIRIKKKVPYGSFRNKQKCVPHFWRCSEKVKRGEMSADTWIKEHYSILHFAHSDSKHTPMSFSVHKRRQVLTNGLKLIV